MITVENLTKKYGRKTAVSDLSFQVQPGRVTGFLGPNGSGKSTTMRCMLGIDIPNAGRTTFDGVEYQKLPSPLTKVGALLDGKAFHGGRTARQHLLTVAATHGFSRERVEEVLRLTGIENVAKKQVKTFSLGMCQRLGVATALLGNPEVLILDEPVNGLDPDGVRWIRQLVRTYAQEGRSVLISSHLMSEMAITADDLIIIGKGKLLASGPITQFTQSASHSKALIVGADNEQIYQVLTAAGYSAEKQPADSARPRGYIEVPGVSCASIGNLLYTHNCEIHELQDIHSSLEDVFMEMTAGEFEYTSRRQHGEKKEQ